ncbi:MAG: phosphatidate cytidylyltransferase [Rhodothermales bacterium]|nr:phosphatidate cytidylyltransferase [Rhodothermales bacterium]
MSAPSLPYSGEIARKALHVVAMLIPASMLLIDRTTGLAILAPLAVSAMFLDRYRLKNDAVSDWLSEHLGFMMRADERDSSGNRVFFNGATWVMLTALLLLLVFPARFAAPGMVIAMLADAGAALVGRKWGRRKWPGGSRTVEGTLAFLVTGVVSALFFPSIPWPDKLTAVGIAAVMEIPPLRINDNLLLPFVAATVLWAMAGMPPLW